MLLYNLLNMQHTFHSIRNIQSYMLKHLLHLNRWGLLMNMEDIQLQ